MIAPYSTGIFPSIKDSKWSWAHDGTNVNGALDLLGDGGVKWNEGERQGGWEVRENGTVLDVTFGGVCHKFTYKDDRAVLFCPDRNPASVMRVITPSPGILYVYIICKSASPEFRTLNSSALTSKY